MSAETNKDAASVTWKTTHGTIELLPERGRVLGLTLDGCRALWQPRGKGPSWNLGGERLWFGPESDWFWRKIDRLDFEQYRVPSVLDPDDWTVTRSEAGICETEISLRLQSEHSGRAITVQVRRRFEALPEESPEGGPPSLALQIVTTLEILDGDHGQAVDLWAILQVPPGGEAFVPTTGTPAYRDYFDPCPASEVSLEAEALRIHLGGPALFKIGSSPEQVRGRIGYVRGVNDRFLTIERTFPVDPARSYCDSPLSALGSQGDAVQIFSDGQQFGDFAELETRSPALVCGVGPQSLTETALTRISLFPSFETARTYLVRPTASLL